MSRCKPAKYFHAVSLVLTEPGQAVMVVLDKGLSLTPILPYWNAAYQ